MAHETVISRSLKLKNQSYGVYLAILAGYIVITYLYFPETRRMTIEEIANIFDGAVPFSATGQSDNDDLKK